MSKQYKYKQQIVLGYNEDGKLIRKWIYANTKNELALQKAELQERYKNGGISVDASFYNYAQKWLDVYKATNAKATKDGYKRAIEACSSIHYIPITKITSMDCQKIINDNYDKPDAAKKINLTLNQIFNQLIKDGAITKNPALDLNLPKKVKKPKRILTAKEKDAVRALLSPSDARLDPQQKFLLGLLYFCGLRPEEARGLMPSDFNLSDQTVTIERALSYDGEHGEIKPTKTYNVRTLPLPIALLPIIIDYLKHNKHIYFFSRDNGSLHTKTSYRRLWKKITAQINLAVGGTEDINAIKGLVPYTFRRNYATNLYYSKISLKKAAYLMGHSDTKMIMEVYAQIDDERESLEALRNII